MSAAALRFVDVHKAFGRKVVLDGVSLSVQPGAVHFILGRSGAGKSILIKHVVGLVRRDRGSIACLGQEIGAAQEADFLQVRRSCQLIFQHSTLFDQLTVLQNVAMPLQHRERLRPAVARQRAEAALAQVHAAHLAQRYPAQLGAGLHKRIAVARALALRPQLMLYDEPTTSLDPVAARRTDQLMVRLAQAGQMTQVVVGHDLRSTAIAATHVSFLHAGRVYFEGAPQTFLAATADPVIGPFLDRSGGA